jgi:hypothetical protein
LVSGPTAVFISGIDHVRACPSWKRGAEVDAESAEVALVIAAIAGDVIMVDEYAGREGHRGFRAPDCFSVAWSVALLMASHRSARTRVSTPCVAGHVDR